MDKIFEYTQAIKTGDIERVKLLLSRSDPSVNNNYAIRFAVRSYNFEIVKLLLSDPRVDPSANDNDAIQIAATYNYTETIKLLLTDPRVDPSTDNNYVIQEAVENNNYEIVKLLLSDPRVDPSARNNYAIRWASANSHLEVVKLLLSDPRVDPSEYNNEAIREASTYGHLEVVKLLLVDPRVNSTFDWRGIDEKMKIKLLKDADIELKDELKASLLAINRITPKMRIDKEYKNLIPKSVRKNIIYRAQYQCTIKGEIPPIKLIALANLLKINYDNNISWKELCGKVKFKLLEML